jgi:diguanylate cyclase (GGDEF)-like protein
VLIVDDTPSNILVLGEELKSDYEVFVATSGESALKVASATLPDLILLDIVMAEMDGYEVYRRLQANEDTRKIPVIFITAMNAEEEETRGLAMGAVDYITKPFRLPIVRARVRTHLELKRKTDMLESLSYRDGLTGVFNRRQFDVVIESEWKRALRFGDPLSVILIDIDSFKPYNDNYGHLFGDECLKVVALALSSTLRRSTDFFARYGGEEFVVVLPKTPLDKALIVAESIRCTVLDLRIEHAYSVVAPYVTVSLGVASTIPSRAIDHRQLLGAADNALYRAKEAGRNTIKYREL